MTDARPIILILGPTAAGKTALAIGLARRLPGGGECIGADSMQVYRGMDVGTAKPTAAERVVPHHLLDVADPATDGFTVDAWLAGALRAIDQVRARGRWPIVVGGTNLYVQALLKGLFDGPQPDPALRARIEALDKSWLRARLEAVDPAAAARIHVNDRRRAVRAIEVFELTGRPISEHQAQWDGRGRSDVRIVGLGYSVAAINSRINARVRGMIAAGLLDEVRRLTASGALGAQAAEAVGYRELIEHLAGRIPLAEAVEQIKIRTRRFARKQRSWLRRFAALPESTWIEADDLTAQELLDKALAAISGEDAPDEPQGFLAAAEGGVSEKVS